MHNQARELVKVAKELVGGELSPWEAGNLRESLIIDGLQKLAQRFGFKLMPIHAIDARGDISFYIDQPNPLGKGPESVQRFPPELVKLMRSVGGSFKFVHEGNNGIEANHFDWEKLLLKAGINRRELLETERKRVAKELTAISGDPYWLTVRYPGECSKCHMPIERGEKAFFYPRGRRLYGEKCGHGKEAEADFITQSQMDRF